MTRRSAALLAASVTSAFAVVADALAVGSVDHSYTARGSSRAGTHRAPSRLLIGADEYSLTLSRATLPRGTALIQLVNRGEDPHDLRLRRIHVRGRAASRTVGVPVTRPGAIGELETRLSPGRYRLWCSIAGHRWLGMRAVLRVARR